MTTSKLLWSAMLVGTLALGACDNVGPHGSTATLTQGTSVTTSGRVVYRDRDGGFYGILTDNGGQVEPINLDPQFQKDGLHVKVTGTLDAKHLGSHNWGNPLSLDKVQALKD